MCQYVAQLYSVSSMSRSLSTEERLRGESVAFQLFLLLRTLADYAPDPASSPLQVSGGFELTNCSVAGELCSPLLSCHHSPVPSRCESMA